MSLSDRIREANTFDPVGLVPFIVDGVVMGHAMPDFADALTASPDVFRRTEEGLLLVPDLTSADERTAAVASVLRRLRDAGLIPGWRDELYPVSDDLFAPPMLEIERAAATLFGIRTFAVNLNGYVETTDGSEIWLQRRAATKPINPDKLDVLVSGGQPYGVGLRDNLVKECAEEAGIPADLVDCAVEVGTLTFRCRRDDGVHHGTYFNYDLRLPDDFGPINQDGEVAAFHRWPAPTVIDILSTTREVAFDSALVIIDFLARHDLVEATEMVADTPNPKWTP